MILYLEYHEHSQPALLLAHIKAALRALQLGILLLLNLFKGLLLFQ